MASLWSMFLIGLLGQAPTFRVQALSAEFVYVDAGRAQGLEIGDRLWILSEQGDTLAEIEVNALAENSAACRILIQKGPISPGDIAVLQVRIRPPEEAPPTPEEEVPPPIPEAPAEIPPQPETRPPTPFARISGGISYGFYGIRNDNPLFPNFSQNTARFTLRMREIRGSGYGLFLQIRTRGNRRTDLTPTPTLPLSESQNRFYELAVGYEAPEAFLRYRIGRIASNPFIGMGYLDGGILQLRMSPTLRIGGFLGLKPDLEQLRPLFSRPKGGLFLGWAKELPQRGRYALTASFTGEYREGQIHREYLYLGNTLTLPGRLMVYQSAEVDLNRGWRRAKEKSFARFSLLHLTVTTPILKRGNLGLSLGHYRRYWTSEIRTLPDSLFDQRARRNLSLRLSWSHLPGGFRTSGAYTLRWREGLPGRDKVTILRISHGHLSPLGLFLSAQISWYHNRFARGQILVLRTGKSLPGGHRLGITYGRSHTEPVVSSFSIRKNRWLRADLSLNLPWGFYLLGQYERDQGTDLQGTRFFFETGYRF